MQEGRAVLRQTGWAFIVGVLSVGAADAAITPSMHGLAGNAVIRMGERRMFLRRISRETASPAGAGDGFTQIRT
jgi:hypothetical protein